MKRLTKKEEVIMNHFWEKGPLFVRELRELYPEPRPHFSTLSTQVRTLQEQGFIDHKSYGPTYQYFAKVTRDEYKQRSLIGLIDKYFDNSYLSAVSALVDEEKITVEERQIRCNNSEKIFCPQNCKLLPLISMQIFRQKTHNGLLHIAD